MKIERVPEIKLERLAGKMEIERVVTDGDMGDVKFVSMDSIRGYVREAARRCMPMAHVSVRAGEDYEDESPFVEYGNFVVVSASIKIMCVKDRYVLSVSREIVVDRNLKQWIKYTVLSMCKDMEYAVTDYFLRGKKQ